MLAGKKKTEKVTVAETATAEPDAVAIPMTDAPVAETATTAAIIEPRPTAAAQVIAVPEAQPERIEAQVNVTTEKLLEIAAEQGTPVVPLVRTHSVEKSTGGAVIVDEDGEIVPRSRQVMIVCEGALGKRLLMKGDITDDPEYVALLDTTRGRTLVVEVS